MKHKIILLVAISKDNFITDKYGNGNFSSVEDKKQFASFLHGNQCDCFVCGQKTADEFKYRLTYKPLFILSRNKKENKDNYCYVSSIQELLTEMNNRNLTKCALLGGAETYRYFLENNAVNEMRITREDVIFNQGVSLNLQPYLSDFKQTRVHHLSPNTKLFVWEQKQRTG